MDASHVENDLVNILFTEEQIQQRLGEMALQITDDYAGRDLLVVGVLRGAVINGPGLSDFCVRFVDETGRPITDLKTDVR